MAPPLPPSPRQAFARIPISGKECHLFSDVFEEKIKPASYTVYAFESGVIGAGLAGGEYEAKAGQTLDECWAKVGRN